MAGFQGGSGSGLPQGSDIATQTDITSGSNPYSGFASRYAPGTLAGTIWDNPWMVLPDVFQGINTGGIGYQSLRNLGADPLTLYNLMNPGRRNIGAGSNEGDFANFLNNLYSSLGTPGGRGFSAAELLGNIFNAAAPQIDANGQPVKGKEGSVLGGILTAGDASTQLRTLFNLLREATNVSMNPYAARGYQAYAQRAGDVALNQAAKSQANTGAGNQYIYQLLKNIAPGLAP
jgi:hypothetical protein